jgi:hypothetical protein
MFLPSWVRTLNCPLFLNRRVEIARFWLLHFFDVEVLDAAPAHPRRPQLAWFSFSGVRTLNCPLFEFVEIEHAKKP